MFQSTNQNRIRGDYEKQGRENNDINGGRNNFKCYLKGMGIGKLGWWGLVSPALSGWKTKIRYANLANSCKILVFQSS